MHATLVIMAAGMGSRYGGNKQIDGVGPSGEILMEYSIYDAIRAGFDKIVFIIKPDMEQLMRDLVGDRIAKKVKVEYAFQDFSSLPPFYTVPKARVKPFGTVHAVLCAKPYVNEPFAVLNADDYYGISAFKTMYDCLVSLPQSGQASMVGYRLKNTVSKNGTVTRGVCAIDAAGELVKVKETFSIKLYPDGTIWDTVDGEKGDQLDPESLVSMNFWGFAPSMFDQMGAYFDEFLKKLPPEEIKGECLLPIMADEMMHKKSLAIKVLSTDAVWFGITYKEDKAIVQSELAALHESKKYPASLREA